MTSSDAGIARLATAITGAARTQGATAPEVRRADWIVAVVTAVNADGTVDVGTIRARRLASYVNPAVGDTIALSSNGAGSWMALGRAATTTDDYQNYTPTFAAGGGGAIGNGQVAGRYLKIARRVDFEIQCTFGSTSTYGTGSFSFTLPVTGATRSTGAGAAAIRLARLSPGAAYPAVGQIGTSTVGFIATVGSTNSVSANVPFAWGAGDIIRISGTYEAAT